MRLLLKRAAVGAIALAVSVSLAGCDEDDGPNSAPPSYSSSVPETSSPTEPTTTTGQALEPVQVVRTWVDAFNAALRGGDPDEAVRLTTDDCWTCDEHIDPVIKALDRGGWFRGGRWTVDRARVSDRSTKKASVYSAISADAGTTLTRRGATPVQYESDRFILQFELEQSDNAWLISKIVYLS